MNLFIIKGVIEFMVNFCIINIRAEGLEPTVTIPVKKKIKIKIKIKKVNLWQTNLM